jgi:sterol desaturase/sphingolipid hydroxylase (fatty acid hydroxylase superfamily)
LDRPRFVRLALCAAAAIGVFAAALALLLALRWQPAVALSNWVIGLVMAKWRGGWLPFVTVLAIILELFFLGWEKTTMFRVFIRRGSSAITDLGFALLTFSSFKWIADYVFSLGLAFAAVKLGDALATRLGWMRWEMPSDGLLEVAFAFSVYFLMSTFVGYWQHRLMHSRWFWHLHRFHHSGTDYNIFTAFRVNPAEMMSNLIPVLSPMIFLKAPNAGLFVAFVLADQALGSFQHSELPWNFGWFGRWVVVSPRNHQIHHSIDEEHRDRNFSNCPLWDRMFGTWYGGPNLPSAYGIPDPAHVERPRTQWLIDIWIFYRDVVLALAGLARFVATRVGWRPPLSRPIDTPVSVPSE